MKFKLYKSLVICVILRLWNVDLGNWDGEKKPGIQNLIHWETAPHLLQGMLWICMQRSHCPSQSLEIFACHG